MAYHGEYKSSTLSQTGCVKRFVTTASESILFHPQVTYSCDLCKDGKGKPVPHGFTLVKTWLISTKRQTESFEKYCDNNSIERGVNIQ